MEINIAVTGRNGSGKSSLIACIYEAMREKMPGYFSLPEAEDFDALDKVYKDLEAKASSDMSNFSVAFTKSEKESWEYQINFRDNVQFFFQENPEDINGTRIFIAAVDAPLLMNNYEAQSGIAEAKEIFMSALESSEQNALLIIVPVKSEAYNRQDKHALNAKISSELGELSEGYRGRASIAIVNVSTMGGASFADFLKKDGTITGEIFRRDKNINFQPSSAELVMKLAVSFLIHDGEISGDNLKKIAALTGENIEILCGHELFDISKPNKPAQNKNESKSVLASALKISAVIIIILAVAGAGFYAVKSMSENTQIIIDENNQQLEQTKARAEQEISEAKEAERAAILERNKARNELRSLQDEKDRAMEMANRYKKQLDELKVENERLQGEVNRLTKKLNDSIRIPNPFK